jgi:polyhydroxybutyrate depolymerase
LVIFFLAIFCSISALNSALAFDLKSNHKLQNIEFEHDGLDRHFEVYIPTKILEQKNSPAVIMLHGGGGDIDSIRYSTQIEDLADEEGFVVIYPEGTGKKLFRKIFAVWNAKDCCPPEQEKRADDLGFIREVISRAVLQFNLNPKRIYVAGHSNGAMMAYNVACNLSEKVAAIAAVGAVPGKLLMASCNPKRFVPTLHIHGKLDQCAKFEGGRCGGCFASLLSKSEPENFWDCDSVSDFWHKLQAIAGEKSEAYNYYKVGEASCARAGSREKERSLCIIGDNGHVWPGGNYGIICKRSNARMCQRVKEVLGPASSSLNANKQIWEFFMRHSLDK